MRRQGRSRRALFDAAFSVFSIAVLAAAPLGCGNPAVDARIEALGEENPNVPPSELRTMALGANSGSASSLSRRSTM